MTKTTGFELQSFRNLFSRLQILLTAWADDIGECAFIQGFRNMRSDVIVASVVGLIFILGLLQLVRGPVFIRLPKFLIQGLLLDGSSPYDEFSADFVAVRSIQGRRPNMEDRFLCVEVKLDELADDLRPVKINAVLDGHGGEFSVVYVKKRLTSGLIRSIKLLKMLKLKSLTPQKKLKLFLDITKSTTISGKVLLRIGITEQEFLQIVPTGTVSGSSANSSPKSNSSPKEKKPIVSAQDLVMTERNKPLEELPVFQKSSCPEKDDEGQIENVLSLNTSSLKKSESHESRKSKFKKSSKKAGHQEVKDVTDFLKGDRILYGDLLKYEIFKIDRELLTDAKRVGQLGGTTLLLSILDENMLWVANVGDSRGVMACSNTVTPLSYDHKPSQLKEKRRIEEAGGFVAMNGVWRVQGILATSRAMGDYPLKERKLITCEPDILSFDLCHTHGGSPDFAILATDGLWDVLTNEGAVGVARSHLRVNPGDIVGAVKYLTDVAYHKDSLDNITTMILDLRKWRMKKKKGCVS